MKNLSRSNARLAALAAIVALAPAVAAAESPDPRVLLETAQNSGTPKTMQSTMTMTLVDRGGRSSARELELRKVGNGKQLVWFTKPTDVRGTAFLRLGEGSAKQMWLYLPGFKKLDRISGARENESFLGSDFTYADMNDRDLDAFDHKLLGEDTVDGMAVWKIESTAKDPDAEYGKVVSYIVKETGRLLQEDLYDSLGDLVKRKQHSRFEKIGTYNIPAVVKMTDLIGEHSTTLESRNLKVDESIDDGIFTTQHLKRIRP
jgi:outer membrane lipoprotein-sorting protein